MAEETKQVVKPKRPGRLRRAIKIVAVTIGLVFLAGLGVLYWASREGYLGQWAKEEVVTELHQLCDIDATFDTFTFDPFPPAISMSGLRMKHLDGRPLISVEEAIVNLQILPLFARRIQLDRVALLAPEAAIALEGGKIDDLPRCVQPTSSETSAPIVLGIRELDIERGKFDLRVDQKVEAHLDAIGVRLKPRTVSAGSDLTIDMRAGQVSIDGRPLVLSHFRFGGQIEGLLTAPRAVVIDQLEARVGDLVLGGKGSIDLLGPVYEAKLDVAAPLAMVKDFVPDAPPLDGHLKLDVSVSGTAATPSAVGRVMLEKARVDDFSFGDQTTLDFHADRKGVDVTGLEIRLGDGTVRAKARLELEEHLPIKIETEATDLQLARVLDSVGILGAWADFRANGKSTLAGTLMEPTQLDGAFDYDIDRFYVFDRPFDRPEVRDHASADPKYVLLHPPGHIQAKGRWGFNPKGVSFSEAELSSGQTSGRAEANIHFATTSPIRVEASLPQLDLADIGPIGGIHFGGRGSVSAHIMGTLSTIAGMGTIELEDTTVTGIPFGHTRGDVVWHDDVHLDFHDIRAKLGETTYGGELSVVIDKEVPFVIKGHIDGGRLQDLLVPFGQKAEEWGDPKGRLTSGVFALTGPITKLSGPIDLAFEKAEVVGEKFEKGRAVGRMEHGAVVLEDLELDKHGATVLAKGRIDPASRVVRASARVRNMTLQKIDVLHESQPTLDGKLAVDLLVGGSIDAVTGTVTARLTELRAGPVELEPGALEGRIHGAHMSVKGKALGKSLDVAGEIDLRSKLPYRATLDLAEHDIPMILAGLRGHTHWTGKVAGKAKLSGSLVDWHLSSGDVLLEKATLDTGSMQLETTGPAQLVMREGVLDTKHLGITGPKTKLVAEGRLGAHVIDLKVLGKIDLAIAELITPSVEKAGGVLSIDSAIEGTPGSMNLVGTGRVEGGLLQWRGFDERISGFAADLVFSQSTVLIERGEGRVADGRLRLNGTVQLDNYRVKDLALQVSVEDIRPRLTYQPVDLSGVLNGSISMDGRLDRLVVRGELEVVRGYAKPKVDLTKLGDDKGRLAVNVYDPSQETVDMDIGFRLLDPLHVKNDQVDLELKGELRLTGTNQRFGIMGTTNVIRGGRVALFSREFEMIAGIFEFQDRYRFSPRYDLSVSTEACAARIVVNIVGDLQHKPQASYTSNPEMDERNILSCIVKGVKDQDRNEDLAKIGGNILFKGLGLDREVKKVLPVDDIDVTTEYSSQTKTYEPRVLLAKELSILGGPARLEYTSALGKREDQELRLRLRITPKLTLQGGWTSSKVVQPVVGDLHLDLKYRWEW